MTYETLILQGDFNMTIGNPFVTGISDFHKLKTTILRKKISNGNSKIIHYRNYNSFDKSQFDETICKDLASLSQKNFQQLKNVLLENLDRMAPLKKKKLRYNHNPFMTKCLRKAIMTRSRLKNRFTKYRSNEN